MKYILLLVYLYLGKDSKQPQLEIYRKDFKTIEACQTEGNAKIATQSKDPHFVTGLFGDCIEIPPINKL